VSEGDNFCVYGAPPRALAEVPAGAVQVSPLVPGARALETIRPASLAGAVIAAPPGTLERRYALALALQALKPGAPLAAMAPKEKGGARLRKELEAFGCAVQESGRQHQRICHTTRPEAPTGIEAALAAGALQYADTLGLWTQPGVFSWDRLDAGARQLIAALPQLSGRGADLGCGVGVLAKAALASQAVTGLALIDLDRRAIAAAKRNIEDRRATFHWADALTGPDLTDLDFVVMNPPFHDQGVETRALGQAFIRRAHQILRKGGALWLVANRHMPYEMVLNERFPRVTPKGDGGGFKLYEARK
jgi:16S rRNA (guanine1207-N2)-methyltransferase